MTLSFRLSGADQFNKKVGNLKLVKLFMIRRKIDTFGQ